MPFNQTIFSMTIGLKENRYKLLHRYYLTPSRLAKMFPEVEDKCWLHCGMLGGTVTMGKVSKSE